MDGNRNAIDPDDDVPTQRAASQLDTHSQPTLAGPSIDTAQQATGPTPRARNGRDTGRGNGNAAPPRERLRRGIAGRAALVVVAVGVLITIATTTTAWSLNRHSEHRLLQLQTRQAAAVITSTILTISEPLTTAEQIETATGGDRTQFTRFMSADTGPGRLFTSASLWVHIGSTWHPVVTVGAPLTPTSSTPSVQAFMTHADESPTFVVRSIHTNGAQRIGYAVGNPHQPHFVVYAERSIPANRRVPVESGSAFSDLNYATYLGSPLGPATLATTDVAASRLPLTGDTARETIPFGDTTLTLIASPRGQLGGPVGTELPWICFVVGAILTVGAAIGASQLVNHRREAEDNARTIAGLYDDLDHLYGQQRTIAETLQHALLPAYNPDIPNLEVATRYVAGAEGVDVGGDWYSMIPVDDEHFAFAIGDVSGRGVSAATIMARLRFTIRAYLTEGHPPNVVLEMCSNQIDIAVDEHFATVIVGIGSLVSREVTISSAGHFEPLIISGATREFASTPVGVPLGVGPDTYESTTFGMSSGATLVAFTDGLVERRGESIDDGLRRLAATAAGTDVTLDDLLTRLVAEMTENKAEDDIAILAFRWTVPD